MFRPSSANSEFIEIYNRSVDSSIDLANYKIIYYTSNADEIIEHNQGMILPPESFAVILEGDYDFTNGLYVDLIPEEALILKLNNNSFGSSGMSNSSDRTINLVNAIGDTVEVYTYSANNSAGLSDEKIFLTKDNSPLNWANSIVVNGTPGMSNSVSPKQFDLEVTNFSYDPPNPFADEEIQFYSVIKNNGTSTAENFSVDIFIDLNSDSTSQENEILTHEDLVSLNPRDSITIQGFAAGLASGSYEAFAAIIFALDDMPDNNIKSISFYVSPKPNDFNDIVINEIMYKPPGDEPEWIELFNRSTDYINLKGWRIADKTSSALISDSSLIIQPEEYLILSDDESINDFYRINSSLIILNLPSLNNSGDNLKLSDLLTRGIDSLNYLSSWGGSNGSSLERISVDEISNDSTNWGSNISNGNGTPGELNSITPKTFDLIITEFSASEDYAVVGQILPTNIVVKNIGIEPVVSSNIQIYYDENRDSIAQIGEFLSGINAASISPNDSVMFNYDITEFTAGQNNYIALIDVNELEFSDNNSAYLNFNGVDLNEERGDLIINEIMYSPSSPEPEWIEIFNKSNKIINLLNYQISDENDTSTVVTESIDLFPNEYLVISKDSTIYNIYPEINNTVVAYFPTLNNSGDRIMILDSLNRIVDSLFYSSSWGGTNGLSLERIDQNNLFSDSSNWGSSTVPTGGTPGNINSLSQKNYDLELTNILFNPELPMMGDNVNISVNIKNIGKEEAYFTIELFEDVNLDSSNFVFLESSLILNLAPGDSLNHLFTHTITGITKEHAFFLNIVFPDDEDTTNNFAYSTISPGYPQNLIIVNEIMYSPINGEPEWVELFNASESEVDLKNWELSDIHTSPNISIISDNNYFFEPKSFLVIAKDSSITDYHSEISSPILVMRFANLNNDIDGIVIKDINGNLIDSVEYNRNWGGTEGYSLERKLITAASNDSVNWASSKNIELSTPGRANSITPKIYDLELFKISTTPNLPSYNEDVFINVMIKNIGLEEISSFDLTIYTGDNISMSTFEQKLGLSLISGDSLFLQTDNSFLLSDSVKIIAEVFSNLDEDTTNNSLTKYIVAGYTKSSVVITEFMSNPNEDESEWIEFYNASPEMIDLKNWSVSDYLSAPTKNKITGNHVLIESGQYFITASDTASIKLPGHIEIFKVNFGTLGNTEDGIIIYDFNEKVIDSLRYDSDWQIEKGRSLERINFNESTNEISNWFLSLNETGGTPGEENSFVNIESYSRNDLVINEIMFDPESDNSEYIEIFNPTDNFIELGGWKFIDEANNQFELSETFFELPPNEFFVFSADSSIFINYPELNDHEFLTILNTQNLGLSNSGESIIITDLWGNVIDSVFYDENWHNKNVTITKNKSLERINPALNSNDEMNWSTSVDDLGATPGIVNSIFTESVSSVSSLSFSPNPFSPDGDGFEDFTIISYNLTEQTAQIRIKIFDDRGRLVRTLVNNKASGSSGSVIFDGLDDNNNPLRIGMYIVFLEALNSNSGLVEVLKNVVVVARKF